MGAVFYIDKSSVPVKSLHPSLPIDKSNGNYLRGYCKANAYDDHVLKMVSRCLVGKAEDTTFTDLINGIVLDSFSAWEETYDVIAPFDGLTANPFDSVWVFDLPKSILTLTNRDFHGTAPLRLARQRLLSVDDFTRAAVPQIRGFPDLRTVGILSNSEAETTTRAERFTAKPERFTAQPEPFTAMIRKSLTNAWQLLRTNVPWYVDFHQLPVVGPYWKPEIKIAPTASSFIHIILRDFLTDWRHLLQRRQSLLTFAKLAHAVVWLSTMEFTIKEPPDAAQRRTPRLYVRRDDLPAWESPGLGIFRIRNACFVLHPDPLEALEMIRKDIKEIKHNSVKRTAYIILTLRYVALCRINSAGTGLEITEPEILTDGLSRPSNRAINLLLSAAYAEPRNVTSALDKLPLEIRDMIFEYLTQSGLIDAKLRYDFGLGWSFSWYDGGCRVMKRVDRLDIWEQHAVESQIWFGNHMSGLSYQARTTPIWKIHSSYERSS